MSDTVSETQAEIRRDMNETRAEIEDTLHRIETRVSPQGLENMAKDGLVHVREFIEEQADRKLSGTTSYIEKASQSAANFVKDHPLAFAGIGVACGLLLGRRTSNDDQSELNNLKQNKEK